MNTRKWLAVINMLIEIGLMLKDKRKKSDDEEKYKPKQRGKYAPERDIDTVRTNKGKP